MGYRTLVIEDEAAFADALRMKLERDGYEVTIAPNQRDAYHLLDEQVFDFALLDLRLPTHDGDMDRRSQIGFEILDHIRKRFSRESLPVIVMTAYEETSQTAVRALRAGANDYITKPFEDSSESLDEKLAILIRVIEGSDTTTEAGKHKLVFTRESVIINGIVVANARYSDLLFLLGTRTMMLSCEARAASDVRLKKDRIAEAMNIEEASVYKLVSRFREWISSEFETRGLGPLDNQAIIKNTPWKGYELNFEACYITRE